MFSFSYQLIPFTHSEEHVRTMDGINRKVNTLFAAGGSDAPCTNKEAPLFVSQQPEKETEVLPYRLEKKHVEMTSRC